MATTGRYDLQLLLFNFVNAAVPDPTQKLVAMEQISLLREQKLRKVASGLSRQLISMTASMLPEVPQATHDHADCYIEAAECKKGILTLYQKHIFTQRKDRQYDLLYCLMETLSLDSLFDFSYDLEESLHGIQEKIAKTFGDGPLVYNMKEAYELYQKLATESIENIMMKYREKRVQEDSSARGEASGLDEDYSDDGEVHTLSPHDIEDELNDAFRLKVKRTTAKKATTIKRLTENMNYLVAELQKCEYEPRFQEKITKLTSELGTAAWNIAKCNSENFYNEFELQLEHIIELVTDMLCVLDQSNHHNKEDIIHILERVQNSIIEELEVTKPLRAQD
jgi:hypothetical protein